MRFNKFSIHRAEAWKLKDEGHWGTDTDMSFSCAVYRKLSANRKAINNDKHNNNLEAGDTQIFAGNQKYICRGVNIKEMLMAQKKHSSMWI